MVHDLSDDILMTAFRERQEKAFEQVYNRYFPKLYLLAFRLLRDREEAKDVVIMIINKAFERHRDFDSLGALNNWLYRSVRNLCTDRWDSRRSELQRNQYWMDDINGGHLLANDELDAELAATLLATVDKLPERSREVVVLYYMHGLKYREIAEKLQVSPKTVENLLRYALDRLRRVLGDDIATIVTSVLLCIIFSKIL